MSEWTKKEHIDEIKLRKGSRGWVEWARHRFYCQDTQGDNYVCSWSCHISTSLLDWDESPHCSHSCRSPGHWCRQNWGHMVMGLGHTHQYLQRTWDHQTTEGTRRYFFPGMSDNRPFTSAFHLLLCEVQPSTAWCKARVTGTEVAPKGISARWIGRAHIQALINICVGENGWAWGKAGQRASKSLASPSEAQSRPLNNGSPTRTNFPEPSASRLGPVVTHPTILYIVSVNDDLLTNMLSAD